MESNRVIDLMMDLSRTECDKEHGIKLTVAKSRQDRQLTEIFTTLKSEISYLTYNQEEQL